jgi:hypothetical protein
MRLKSPLMFGVLTIVSMIFLFYVIYYFRIQRSRTGSSSKQSAMMLRASSVVATRDQTGMAWQMLQDFSSQVQSGGDGIDEWESACDLFPEACDNALATKRVKQTESMEFHKFQPAPIPGSSYRFGDTIIYNSTAKMRLESCESDSFCNPSAIQFQPGDLIARIAWYSFAQTNCTKIQTFDPGEDSGSFDPDWPVTVGTQTCGEDAVPVSSFLNQGLADKTREVLRNREGPGHVPLASDDTMVMVAFHLMEMQKDGWHWATFWWSTDTTNSGDTSRGFACASPSPCLTVEPWNHYVMNTTAEPDSGAHFVEAANPYLDSGTAVHSNCIVCHSFAMAPNCVGSPRASCPPTTPDEAVQTPGGNCGAQHAQAMTQDLLDSAEQSYKSVCTQSRESTNQVWSIAEYTFLPNDQCKPYDCGEISTHLNTSVPRNHAQRIKEKRTEPHQ